MTQEISPKGPENVTKSLQVLQMVMWDCLKYDLTRCCHVYFRHDDNIVTGT